jgi:hypothetical protein
MCRGWVNLIRNGHGQALRLFRDYQNVQSKHYVSVFVVMVTLEFSIFFVFLN